jgi:hypothetical protein
MCKWYAHIYDCKHTTYALGKYCRQASLVQTACKQKNIWRAIRMEEECRACAGCPRHVRRDDDPNAEENEAQNDYKNEGGKGDRDK